MRCIGTFLQLTVRDRIASRRLSCPAKFVRIDSAIQRLAQSRIGCRLRRLGQVGHFALQS